LPGCGFGMCLLGGDRERVSQVHTPNGDLA
jgi:hypothetical protein